jgi:hypothetical protein
MRLIRDRIHPLIKGRVIQLSADSAFGHRALAGRAYFTPSLVYWREAVQSLACVRLLSSETGSP